MFLGRQKRVFAPAWALTGPQKFNGADLVGSRSAIRRSSLGASVCSSSVVVEVVCLQGVAYENERKILLQKVFREPFSANVICVVFSI